MENFMEYQERMEDERKLFEIDQAHKLTLEMQDEVAKYTTLASLALRNEIQTMKNSLRGRWLHLTYTAEGAQKWLSMLEKGEKPDGRKKCEERDQYEFLTNQIEALLDVKVTIKDISFLNYSNDAYYIVFNTESDSFDRDFEIVIPDTEKLRADNLLELDYGKIRINVRNEANSSCWDSICSSYHKEELKNKFKEFLTPRPV